MNELATKIARVEIRDRVFKHLRTLHGERYSTAYAMVLALGF
jgi:hypothetical protein